MHDHEHLLGGVIERRLANPERAETAPRKSEVLGIYLAKLLRIVCLRALLATSTRAGVHATSSSRFPARRGSVASEQEFDTQHASLVDRAHLVHAILAVDQESGTTER
jgi:hypothetical protein